MQVGGSTPRAWVCLGLRNLKTLGKDMQLSRALYPLHCSCKTIKVAVETAVQNNLVLLTHFYYQSNCDATLPQYQHRPLKVKA